MGLVVVSSLAGNEWNVALIGWVTFGGEPCRTTNSGGGGYCVIISIQFQMIFAGNIFTVATDGKCLYARG